MVGLAARCVSLLFLLGFGLSGHALAQAENELIVGVQGEVTRLGLKLSVETGRFVTRGLRVYSEPSHTLLLLALDPEFEKSVDGIAWAAQFSGEEPRARVTTPLPHGRPVVHIRARPESDTGIHVWVNGLTKEGAVEDRLVSAARLATVGSFAFTTSTSPNSYHHCCEGGGCAQMCKTCSGLWFACCLIDGGDPGCCHIVCGNGPDPCINCDPGF